MSYFNDPTNGFAQAVDSINKTAPVKALKGKGALSPDTQAASPDSAAISQALLPGAAGAAGGAGAAGAAGGAAAAAPAAGGLMQLLPLLMCMAAEATFGIDDPRTNRARYTVNVEWPEWAKGVYRRNMHTAAAMIRRYRLAKSAAKVFFTLVGHGKPQMKSDGTIVK